VLDVVEVLAARSQAGGAAEEVDHHGVVPGLGEPFGELDVERVEAADVRVDEDARAADVARSGERR
jgi:hypothetical protein